MLYFGLYVQLRRGSVAGYTTDESWAYGPKEGVEAFESITFFIRFMYAVNFEHLLIFLLYNLEDRVCLYIIGVFFFAEPVVLFISGGAYGPFGRVLS